MYTYVVKWALITLERTISSHVALIGFTSDSDDYGPVVVVCTGCGVFGVSTALHFLKAGYKDVLIIDKVSCSILSNTFKTQRRNRRDLRSRFDWESIRARLSYIHSDVYCDAEDDNDHGKRD